MISSSKAVGADTLLQLIKNYSKVDEDDKSFPIKKPIININNPKSIILRQFWKSLKE